MSQVTQKFRLVTRSDFDGLVCAVVQQYDTREVLMVAWMDAEALRRTVTTGAGTYWSRSRQEYWVKGATSGHTQRVVDIFLPRIPGLTGMGGLGKLVNFLHVPAGVFDPRFFHLLNELFYGQNFPPL